MHQMHPAENDAANMMRTRINDRMCLQPAALPPCPDTNVGQAVHVVKGGHRSALAFCTHKPNVNRVPEPVGDHGLERQGLSWWAKDAARAGAPLVLPPTLVC